jgi:hypothetical protein
VSRGGQSTRQRPAPERFWEKVDRTGDCWLWLAATSAGYGRFKMGGRMQQATRIAYEWEYGPIPKEVDLDHRTTCPKICVRPDHLRPVTRKQNQENRAGAQTNSLSGVRGVSWDKGAWMGRVRHHGKKFYVGRFSTVEEAEAAVIAKRLELFTHNDVDQGARL